MTKEIEYRINCYAEGRKAMKRIDTSAAKNIHDWMIVGESMHEARQEAFNMLGTNRANNLAFRREFGEILKREKLHEDTGGPDKTTRAFLLQIMDHEAEVLAWHASLPKAEKRAWTHPSSVWRHFDKKDPKDQPTPKPSKTTGLTKQEEAECVENMQIQGLQKRDAKIAELRDTIRELRADNLRLRQLLLEHGITDPKPPLKISLDLPSAPATL